MLPPGEKTMSRLNYAKSKLLMVLAKLCPAQLYDAEFWSHLFMGFGAIIHEIFFAKNRYVNSV